MANTKIRLIIFFAAKDGEALHIQQNQDRELTVAQKRVGKTTRQFMYDLNQFRYDYTVEVRNIFKGLDLIDTVPDELWTDVCDIVQWIGIKTIPKKKEMQKSKRLSEETLKIAVKRREAKSKGKRKDIPI